MDYLMLGAFLIVGFFLGAVFINIFNARKITALKQEAQGAQSRYYELQDRSKKQLKEKDESISKLITENSTIKKNALFIQNSLVNDSGIVNSIKDENTLLKQELASVKAKNKELKVEKAVQSVEKKYPMQLYGMDGVAADNNDHKNRTKLKKQKALEKKQKAKKKKSNAVANKEASKLNTPAPIFGELEIDDKDKAKKSKKKSKSKKRKSKKVLALFKEGVKKKKKSKKKKKKAK